MKKLILTLISGLVVYQLQAQNINPNGDHERINMASTPTHTDSLSGWCIDFDFMAGLLSQQYNTNSLNGAYIDPLNPNESGIDHHLGMSYGFELQGGYFFGKKKNWGIGMGLLYMYQASSITNDVLHVEYASYDSYGNIFRQEITSTHQIKETIHTNSFNIPIVAKYQKKFSKKIGFTADAGVLFNLHVTNKTKTNAAFDYEAVYKYVDENGVVSTVYDNGNPPSSSDLLITKEQYQSSVSGTTITDYFNAMRAQGYNVGVNESPRSNTDKVSYQSGSFGIIIRPAINIDLYKDLSLNVGVYYYYQYFTNKALSNYHITDRVGEYSSMLNTVNNAQNHSYGVTVGLRYSFPKKQKSEPETTPTVEPDPVVEVASPSPEPDEKDEVDHVDISTPMLFDLNKVTIKEESIPILDEAVRELKSNPDAKLVIHGYTDNTGAADYNKKLSKRRAAAVKSYLKKKGVDPKILKTVGHGESHPAVSNRTKAGRAKNRRVIMKMKDQQ